MNDEDNIDSKFPFEEKNLLSEVANEIKSLKDGVKQLSNIIGGREGETNGSSLTISLKLLNDLLLTQQNIRLVSAPESVIENKSDLINYEAITQSFVNALNLQKQKEVQNTRVSREKIEEDKTIKELKEKLQNGKNYESLLQERDSLSLFDALFDWPGYKQLSKEIAIEEKKRKNFLKRLQEYANKKGVRVTEEEYIKEIEKQIAEREAAIQEEISLETSTKQTPRSKTSTEQSTNKTDSDKPKITPVEQFNLSVAPNKLINDYSLKNKNSKNYEDNFLITNKEAEEIAKASKNSSTLKLGYNVNLTTIDEPVLNRLKYIFKVAILDTGIKQKLDEINDNILNCCNSTDSVIGDRRISRNSRSSRRISPGPSVPKTPSLPGPGVPLPLPGPGTLSLPGPSTPSLPGPKPSPALPGPDAPKSLNSTSKPIKTVEPLSPTPGPSTTIDVEVVESLEKNKPSPVNNPTGLKWKDIRSIGKINTGLILLSGALEAKEEYDRSMVEAEAEENLNRKETLEKIAKANAGGKFGQSIISGTLGTMAGIAASPFVTPVGGVVTGIAVTTGVDKLLDSVGFSKIPGKFIENKEDTPATDIASKPEVKPAPTPEPPEPPASPTLPKPTPEPVTPSVNALSNNTVSDVKIESGNNNWNNLPTVETWKGKPTTGMINLNEELEKQEQERSKKPQPQFLDLNKILEEQQKNSSSKQNFLPLPSPAPESTLSSVNTASTKESNPTDAILKLALNLDKKWDQYEERHRQTMNKFEEYIAAATVKKPSETPVIAQSTSINKAGNIYLNTPGDVYQLKSDRLNYFSYQARNK